MALDNKTLEDFGIDAKLYAKSKNILPTLDLAGLEQGAEVIVQFLEDRPNTIEVKDINDPDKKVPVQVMTVFVHSIRLPQPKSPEKLEVPIGDKQTMFLSSKSLRLGILNLMEDKGQLQGEKAKVLKTTAVYKTGVNTCYRVSEATF